RADPSAEYQTRSTGPVASEGEGRSMAEFPMCRQSRRDWAQAPGIARIATAAVIRPTNLRNVALRHMGRVYCIPFTLPSIFKRPNLCISFERIINGYLLAKHV